jgi:hypothetical protein
MKVAAQPERSSNPPRISRFAHQTGLSAATNPFQFIALRTPSDDGISLLLSFQEATHSFPSHGTGPCASSRFSNFHFPISNFSRLLSLVFATLTDSTSRKSFTCHSYENSGGGTQFFPLWNSQPSTSSCDLSAVSCGPENGHGYKPSSQRFWYA